MTRITVINTGALLVAMMLGWLAVAGIPDASHAAPPSIINKPSSDVISVVGGRPGLRDARGYFIPLKAYQRIASAGIQSDALLIELCEPQRVVSASAWSVGSWTHRLGNLPRVRDLDDIETIIALRPDILFVSTSGGDSDRVARLREAGIMICDLGPQGGLASLSDTARVIGHLIGAPERAEYFITTFMRRMAHVAATLPASMPRRTAVYVQCVGDQLFGGSVGTSIHDVLESAGLRDATAATCVGWPQLSVEQLISLNPDVVITEYGGEKKLKGLPGFSALRAARTQQGIVELDENVLQCSGPTMLDAAEEIFTAVYGPSFIHSARE